LQKQKSILLLIIGTINHPKVGYLGAGHIKMELSSELFVLEDQFQDYLIMVLFVKLHDFAQMARRMHAAFLYSSAARAAKEIGYKKIITYILDSESGTSLKASGWSLEEIIHGHSWNSPGREREDKAPTCNKQRWSKLLDPKYIPKQEDSLLKIWGVK
jgi:hypothetical protein